MKLSQVNYLRSQLQNLPKDLSPTEQIRFIAETTGIQLDSVYQEMEMDDIYVDTHEDPGYSPEGINLHSHFFYEIIFVYKGNIQ